MGDSSDNIPGVAGIGEKTALKLIASAASLDRLYDDPEQSGASAGVCAKLEAGREDAFLSRTLAKICCEVPGFDSVEECKTSGIDSAALAKLFGELEFSAMFPLFGISPSDGKAVPEENTASLHSPEPESVSPEELISHAAEENCISVTEENGSVVLSLFADGEIYTARGDAASFAKLLGRGIICHDAKKLFSVFSPKGIKANVSFDTMLASYLLNPRKTTR